MTNGVVTMTAPFAATTADTKVSATGLIVRAGIGVTDSDTLVAAIEPGFHETPLVSVFDEDAWKLEA